MKKLKPWIVLVLVFAAGVIVGVGGTRFAIRRVIDRVLSNPSLVQARLERDLTRQLRLSAGQQREVHAALERSQGELRQVRDEFRPRIGRILKRSETDIRAVLNEAQQERFDRLLQRRPIVPPAFRAAASAP